MKRGAPIIIVGVGVAGLSAALTCAPRPVLLLSRKQGSEGSASLLAQGGIAAILAPGDSPKCTWPTRWQSAGTAWARIGATLPVFAQQAGRVA